MSLAEPRIAIAASPREWALTLHRHVADHGGAIVRATVLHPKDALCEDVDVFVVDDTTSFLSRRLVDELHRRGRGVLGVFDPDDPRGKDELLDSHVDECIGRDAPPEAFVAAITALTRAGRNPIDRELTSLASAGVGAPARADATAAPAGRTAVDGVLAPAGVRQPGPRGRLVVVAGAAGGVGATEVAVGLAAASGRRGDATVLVDVDDVAPCIAQRLDLPLYPNVRAALDAMEHRRGTVADVLMRPREGGFTVLPGLASGRSWAELRPTEVEDLARALALVGRHVVCNIGHRVEDLPGGPGGTPRYALARHLLGVADVVVAVASASPVGLARLLEWLADVRDLVGDTPAHVVVNRAPADRFRQGEIIEELGSAASPAGLWLVPDDARVAEAAWAGGLAATGPFTRAIAGIADAVLPTLARPAVRAAPPRRRLWSR